MTEPPKDREPPTRPTIDEDALWGARDLIRAAFEAEFEPIESSADGLVTVWLDGGSRLSRVSIDDSAGLLPETREKLEAALVVAAREAADRVANAHANRVAAALKGSSAS